MTKFGIALRLLGQRVGMADFVYNRYRVVRQLGKGGMGTVYLVEDTLRNDEEMALKVIRADLGERDQSQFKHEFAALGQLRHPNLVAVYDFGVIAETNEYFFTMEYVPGEDLPTFILQAQRSGDYSWLYKITVQVCRALQYIHSRGFIHYDVKPRNIRLISQGDAADEWCVKLMDFGLVGEARGEGQQVRGTPEYVAPEMIRGDPVDHRVDLYSLGVSLYEIVAGRLPFADVRQRVEAKPEPPRHFVSDVPEGLQDLILKLLDKEPAKRYGSANAVIQAINEISQVNFPIETKETKRGYIQSGRFVGREFELACLQGTLVRAMQGQGRLVLIAGAAGIGKTRLARELRLRAQMQRALVCEGACREQVRVPYRPWIFSIYSQIISHQQAGGGKALPRHGLSLAKLMPELAAQIGSTPYAAPAAEGKPGLMEAAARLLLESDAPLVLLLEDLQYADAETVELLDYVGQHTAQGRLLVCGVYRDDEIDEAHPLNKVIRQARAISRQREQSPPQSECPYDLLRLDSLAEADAAEFVRSMLGLAQCNEALPAGLLPRLMAETGGNPLFIESVMHSLVEEDLLRYDGAKWRIDVAELSLPATIQEAAQRRLRRISQRPESLDLLQWVAVMGQWLDMDVLMAVCDLPPDHVFGLVADAAQQHVLAASDQAGQQGYRFSTDQMREAVYSTLAPEQRAERHRHIGEALRKLYAESDVAEWLAWHFERAGDARLALRYSKLAADKARQIYANESAIQHYGRALALQSERPALADMQTEYELLAGRQACYSLVGKRQAQQADLDAMARLAGDMGDVPKQVEVATLRVTLAIFLGNNVEAQQAAQAALTLARQVGDRSLEAISLTSLGQAHFALGDYGGSRACHEQALELYRQLGDQPGEAISLRRLGDVDRRAGNSSRAQGYYEQSMALYRALGDRPGEAALLNALGLMSADFTRQRDYHEQSLAIVQAIGDRAGQSRSYNNLGLIYWSLGLYGKARDYFEQAVQIQRETHGRSSLIYYLESLGRVYLEMEDYSQAQQVLEEGCMLAADTGDRWSEALYWMMEGRVALARGRLDEARQLIQGACDVLRELNSIGYLATALAWLGATRMALGDWEAAHRCTCEAVAHVQATGNAGDYLAQDVWWLHYQVLVADPRKTWSKALDDETWACLQGARDVMLEAIATLSDEGLRRNYLNKVRINRDIVTEWTRQSAKRGIKPPVLEEGPAAESPVEAPEADRARDQLKRVLDISLQMNETHDAELLLNYVMDQVIELSGAERGFLVLLDQAGQMDLRVARGMAVDELERAKSQISYTVLGMVSQSKTPILLQDAMTDERFGRQSSVLELNLRSVLCVPLLTRSELVGMIYADNRSVSGRFSQTDVALMSIFANQAATAIENARLYQETLTWARTLEQRVEERTAELQRANVALSRRAVQLETSSQVGQQVTSILALDELLEQIVSLIQSRFGYYFVGVWLVSGTRDWVELHAGSGRAGQDLVERETRLSLETTSLVVEVCQTGQGRLVNDVTQSPAFMLVAELPETRAELTLPLRAGQVIIGALDIQSEQLLAFSHDDQMVLQTLADQIAIAIRNAQFYKTEQTRRWFAESLERAGRELAGSLDLGEVPARILEQLLTVVPYERGSVLLQEGDALRIIAQHGFPETERAKTASIPIREGDVFQQVVTTCRPLVVDDVTAGPGWQQLEWLPVNRSWLGAPLISRDQVMGMISLTRREAGQFSSDDTVLVSTFAGQAAIALENAKLYGEITQFNEQLEQMVQQRTEELNRAYQTLERLDKTKSDFINVAAHELRTPLTVIRGYAQVLEAKPIMAGDADSKDLVKGILSGADRLYNIVNSMLDVTKIDSQTMRMRKERVSLLPLVQGVQIEFLAALQERRLTLALEGLSELPPVQADPNLLYKVFYQLVVNAIKYTPDGGSITITGQDLQPWQGWVEVVVSDTGIGIDPAHHELIFEKFYQTGEVAVHSSGKTKFKGGGPGLGLAIARGVVLAHGGKLWVESKGHDELRCLGSHFHVRLPVKI